MRSPASVYGCKQHPRFGISIVRVTRHGITSRAPPSISALAARNNTSGEPLDNYCIVRLTIVENVGQSR